MFNNRDNQSRGNFAPRQMVQGNWKCINCGKEITELPFTPREEADGVPKVQCRDCWSKNKPPKRY